MKTKNLSDFPDELLKVKETGKKQRWIETSGQRFVRKIRLLMRNGPICCSAGLYRLRKNAANAVILSLAFWGEGSAFRGFKQMQILRRLLAPQNDDSAAFFRSLFSPAHAAQGRRYVQIRTAT